jgi:hypothetical protein
MLFEQQLFCAGHVALPDLRHGAQWDATSADEMAFTCTLRATAPSLTSQQRRFNR